MARKDITDKQVVHAVHDARERRMFATDLLVERTGQPLKVCIRALERACDRDLMTYGVSLRTGWLTIKGEQLRAVVG